jgi:hypothetical protein
MCGWMDGKIDRSMDGWMDGQIDQTIPKQHVPLPRPMHTHAFSRPLARTAGQPRAARNAIQRIRQVVATWHPSESTRALPSFIAADVVDIGAGSAW